MKNTHIVLLSVSLPVPPPEAIFVDGLPFGSIAAIKVAYGVVAHILDPPRDDFNLTMKLNLSKLPPESSHALLVKIASVREVVLGAPLRVIFKYLASRYWTNLDSVNDMEVPTKMEDSVKASIQQIQKQKEKVANQHFVRVDNNNQLQDDLELPFHMSEEPQLQDLSTWIPFDDMPHELNLPSQRDVGCSVGQSFTGPLGYFNMCSRRENALSSVQPSQENSFGANLSQQVPLALDGQYPYPCSFNMVGEIEVFIIYWVWISRRQTPCIMIPNRLLIHLRMTRVLATYCPRLGVILCLVNT